MSYYNWDKIVESKSDSELKKIYRERGLEADEKVTAVVKELKKRKLLSDEEVSLTKKTKFEQIYDLNDIKETRPNMQRAGIAQSLIWIILLFEIVSIYSAYLQLNLLESYKAGEFITEQMITKNDMRQQIIAIVYLIAFIISAVTFIMWFRRAYFNLHNRVSHCESTEGWAAGSWFVPIISLFRPYQIMSELWVKTDKIHKERSGEQFTDNKKYMLVVWWTLWIISSFIGNIVLRLAFDAETISDLTDSTIGDIVMSIIGIPLALITIQIIKTYAKSEEKLYLTEHSNFSSSSIINSNQNTDSLI